MNEHVIYTAALRQLHWLPVDRRVDFKLRTMMHSIHTGQCPTYSSDMVRAVTVNQMRSGLRSDDTSQYIKPRCRIEIGKRVFPYAGPLAWNDLPPSLHYIMDSKCFRKHLKHIIVIVLSSTHSNTCLGNYVRQAISLSLSVLILLLLLLLLQLLLLLLSVISPRVHSAARHSLRLFLSASLSPFRI